MPTLFLHGAHGRSPKRCTSQKTLKHTGMFQFTHFTLSFQPTGCTRDLETTSRLGCWLSCLWVCNCAKKYSSKTAREVPTTAVGAYQTDPDYNIVQPNVIIDVLGEWSKKLNVEKSKIFGARSSDVLKRMQKAVLSSSLNIVRSFKVTTK